MTLFVVFNFVRWKGKKCPIVLTDFVATLMFTSFKILQISSDVP